MLRYYMTPETRQAVIAESNRLIAARAAMNASRRHLDADSEWQTTASPAFDASSEDAPASPEAFARLVTELQMAALRRAP